METVIQIYDEKQRNTRIRKEKKRLKAIFQNMDSRQLNIVEKLIDDAAFEAVTLEETRELIKKNGVIETYQNGANQSGVKKSSAVEVYDKMVNTYSKIIKQLCDLLPKVQAPLDEDAMPEDPAAELFEYVDSLKR